MAFTSPKMGLRVWDQVNDPYDHNQLADNWAKVDLHDHTPGRGVQIPTEGLANGAVTAAKLDPALNPDAVYLSYKNIIERGALWAPATTALTTFGPQAVYAVSTGNPAGQALFYLDAADWNASARTTKFRVRAFMAANNVAPTQGATFSLASVSSLAGATSSTVEITVAPIAASQVTLAAPGAGATTVDIGSDFTLPSPGLYILTGQAAGAFAANSAVIARIQLQMRQV